MKRKQSPLERTPENKKFEKLVRGGKSRLEEHFLRILKENGLENEFVREFKFHSVRRWKSDFACKKKMVIVECEGAVFTRGRHVTGSGYTADCEKYSMASAMGWTILRYTSTKQMDELFLEHWNIISNR